MKRTKSVVSTVIVVFLTALILLSLISKATGKKIFSYTVLWVLTPSMEGTFPAQSYILVKDADPATLEVGDIITFRSSDPALHGALNTHRITWISPDHKTFTTKGDSNYIADVYPVSAEDIEAVYVKNLPVLTFFGRLFATKMGLVAVMLIVMIDLLIRTSILKKKTATKEHDAEINALIEKEVARLEAEAKTEKSDPENRP